MLKFTSSEMPRKADWPPLDKLKKAGSRSQPAFSSDLSHAGHRVEEGNASMRKGPQKQQLLERPTQGTKA